MRSLRRKALFTVSPRTVTCAWALSWNLPDNRRSSIEADPQLRSDAVFRFQIRSCCLEPLKDTQRRSTRPKWRILECHRRAEHGHNAVASKALP
jgi:hypothetical protein